MKPILTSALMLMTLSAGAFTVTEAGKPAAEIVIKADAAEPIATAAKELRHWIKEIPGAELPVARAPSPPRTPWMVSAPHTPRAPEFPEHPDSRFFQFYSLL